MKRIYKRFTKSIALFWVFTLLFQVCFPVISFAITNGPSQPETQGFQPAGTSNMVDLFTGDFQYSIPLFDLEGYPVNLSYQANPGMEDEASWVGLGWTLSPGSVDRNLRGLPDDFKGDEMRRDVNMSDNITYGVNGGVSLKVIGIKKGPGSAGLKANAGIFRNNKKGPGFEFGVSPTFSISKTTKDKTRTLTTGLDLSYNSQNGFDIGGSIGIKNDMKAQDKNDTDLSLGGGINSREGVKNLNFGVDVKATGGKKPQDVAKLNGGLTFGTPTYTPVPDLTFKTRSITLDVGFGGEASPLFPHGHVGGFYTNQYLAEKHISQGAYGYLNSQGAVENDDNLMDFNKEVLAVPYSDRMKKLPMAYGTYDLFSAKAQGLGAQFRAFRGDVGVFRDAASHNGSVGASIGIELGAGNIANVSGSVNIPFSSMDGGDWKSNNQFRTRAAFTSPDGSTLYEPVAFKDAGEMAPLANEQFNQNVGDYDPAFVELLQQAMITTATNRLVSEKNKKVLGLVSNSMPGVLRKQFRERRNSVFSYLNGFEADRFGLDKKIVSYENDDVICGTAMTATSRMRNRGHHISEITVTQPGGTRYVFGLPVYNMLQREVSFSVEEHLPSNINSTLVEYGVTENTAENNSGRDEFYESRETPPYATSYLITGYLSPDYVDLTGNGISDDDAGTAIKFKYTKIDGLYHWRSPSDGTLRKARYSPGNHSDPRDDKGSYVYGERELIYVHSMESKNYIARFFLKPADMLRTDGRGINENGGIDNAGTKLQSLDRIEIFAKSELANNSNPTPIKTVHFEYTQQLCPGVPNSSVTDGGKLTLSKLYFTYGKSERGARNVYNFTYHIPQSEAGYNIANTDRWGMYKRHIPGYPDNNAFPFTYQPDADHGLANESTLDDFASAWNLETITLPTGAVINIDYEPDTYGYVMNKRAGQYIFVRGFSDDPNDDTPSPNLYDIDLQLPPVNFDIHNNNFIFLDLPFKVNSVEEFRQRYLEDVDNLYFNCRVQLDGNNNNTVENITGYASINRNNITLRTLPGFPNQQVAVLQLEEVKGDRGVDLNPIVKAALTTFRTQLPDLAYGAPSNQNGTEEEQIRGLFPLVQDIKDLLVGFDVTRAHQDGARFIRITEGTAPNAHPASWVRLANPTFNKFGGGSRVASVTINDNWDNMAPGHADATYGTFYDYSMPSPLDPEERISSGVATYEPMLGNEENLWRNPLTYNDHRVFLGPKTISYQEAPVGEALFPAPSVGYSQVKVTSTPGTEPTDPHTSTRTGTGYSISKFYTAKDFPTRVDYTTLHYTKYKPNPILRLFRFFSRTNMNMSQGFVVEVNDMHGKPKSEEVYNEAQSMISSTEYRYKTDDNGNLDNVVRMITKEGDLTEGTLGVDMDVWEEMSQEKSSTSGLGASFGVDAGVWGIIPAIFPHVIPIIHNDESTLRTSVTTKFIKRFGIIDKVIKTENGASLASNNLVFDSETGEPLLVETESEYAGEPTYQFKYPAHWAYDGMGQAYHNQDAFFNAVEIDPANAEILDGAVAEKLNAGDEVIVYRKPPFNIPKLNTYHVTKWSQEVPNNLPIVHTHLIDRFGNFLTGVSGTHISIKVKRSARRNMATASIGSFQSLINPAPETANRLEVGTATRVLQSNAVTFNDHWRIPFAYKRTTCDDQASKDDALAILCELTDNDEDWFTNESAGATLCSISEPGEQGLMLNGVNCADLPFYALQPEPAYGYLNEYQVNVGDCIISVRRPDGKKFNPADLECKNIGTCPVPTGLAYTVNGNNVTLMWQPVGGATGYNLEWKEVSASVWNPINNIPPGTTSVTLSPPQILPGLQYEFRVQTICECNLSSFSDPHNFSTCSCAEPVNLDVLCRNCTTTMLRWEHFGSPSSYNLRWRPYGGATWQIITGINGNELPFSQTQGECYVFEVQANCGGCLSDYSPGYVFKNDCNCMDISDCLLSPGSFGQNEVENKAAVSYKLYIGCTEMIVEIECLTCNSVPCEPNPGLIGIDEIFNPYFWGVLGNWRQEHTFAFDNKDTRDYSQPHLNQQGFYKTFNPYWIWDNSGQLIPDALPQHSANWIRANTITKYDKSGNPVEERDALGKYESALFGYKNSLPVARSSNARFTQIGYEGFDNFEGALPSCAQEFCHQVHFPYMQLPNSMEAFISSEKAHTGKNAMKLNTMGAQAKFTGGKDIDDTNLIFPDDLSTGQYEFGNSHIGQFLPVPVTGSRRYVVSAWVYSDLYNCDNTERLTPQHILHITGTPGLNVSAAPSGPIIEGWRKVETIVELNSTMSNVSFSFTNPYSSAIYVDDVRVHPFDGSMQSFTYDRTSLRLMATLDERNYATFYEYDDAGILIRTKRETEKGIVTITENRSYLSPNN